MVWSLKYQNLHILHQKEEYDCHYKACCRAGVLFSDGLVVDELLSSGV